uniref:AlNc14C227G9232 protein n=1 Tax=Albugo laibachii Nc14 TaxID=890382 RepID=F0WS93_9STRA|nr:AlNc14C227G9232 [Albugo laibachii Nc14]CCA26934.1 AlNc14C433G11601 [Albugo laibachii Nc14]|eukprot:CCA26934.1 AlNc14C433G11601 [Albugo laibachii Nc14]
MLGTGGFNPNNNWIREQWIANLKKKQRNQCVDTSLSMFASSYESGEGPFLNYSAQAFDQERSHPDGFMSDNLEYSAHVNVSPSSADTLESFRYSRPPLQNDVVDEKRRTPNTIFKKRSNYNYLDSNEPRPRTPRRKLNCGSASFDLDDPKISNQEKRKEYDTSSYEKLQIPYNPNQLFAVQTATTNNCRQPNTLKCEVLSAKQCMYEETWGSASLMNQDCNSKNFRTSSIDQEGLRQFLEQTHLTSSHSMERYMPKGDTGAYNEITSTDSNQEDQGVEMVQGEELLISPSHTSDLHSPSLTAAITAGYIPNDVNPHDFDYAEFDYLVADCKFLEFDDDLNYLNLVS